MIESDGRVWVLRHHNDGDNGPPTRLEGRSLHCRKPAPLFSPELLEPATRSKKLTAVDRDVEVLRELKDPHHRRIYHQSL